MDHHSPSLFWLDDSQHQLQQQQFNHQLQLEFLQQYDQQQQRLNHQQQELDQQQYFQQQQLDQQQHFQQQQLNQQQTDQQQRLQQQQLDTQPQLHHQHQSDHQQHLEFLQQYDQQQQHLDHQQQLNHQQLDHRPETDQQLQNLAMPKEKIASIHHQQHSQQKQHTIKQHLNKRNVSYLDCRVQNEMVHSMIDTGSGGTYMKSSVARKLELPIIPHEKTVPLAASGQNAKIKGVVLADIEVNGSLHKGAIVEVIDNLFIDMIVGRDIMGKHKRVVLNFDGPREDLVIGATNNHSEPTMLPPMDVPAPPLFTYLTSNIKPVATK